ncbi:RNA polymerase sigma factor SigY [Heyndrickxia oleronia]|uniref:RNA polymerase sigma factor SigY n=1 Tax=Heyndrickxia oleronia TaxID=38875 RepID=UPI00203FFB43|nr:RNA polymerase sigma factor SigY [Heyndrickxia oleronia]MCM3236491.1 RNA polymerase sigma factor SigY [Heyndrickxia oleronia]
MNDKLIDRAKSGDEEAFVELFQTHYSFFYKYIIKMTFDPVVAEDIMQETMLKSYLNIQKYDGSSNWTSWIITIATRIYIDYLRKKKRERWLFKKTKENYSDLLRWQLLHSGYEYDDIMDIIHKLDANHRIPLLLKHYYGFRYDEIAKMLGIKEGTVKSRVHKSILIVRKGLQVNGK